MNRMSNVISSDLKAVYYLNVFVYSFKEESKELGKNSVYKTSFSSTSISRSKST